METQHTPGLWTARDIGMDWLIESVVQLHEYTPAATVRVAQVFYDDTVEADARLIAAAPELLEALYLALNVEGPVSRNPEGLDVSYHFDAMRAAIAKAEGEQL